MTSRPCAFLVALLLPGLWSVSLGCQEPTVNLQQGQVRGRCVVQPHSELRNYYAFEGMPYARPPVGERRFKDPEEPELWHGIKNATTAGSICLQKHLLTQELTGNEDCLFINVYTAHPSTSWIGSKYPVVVWIHPGAFNMGWGNLDILRPDDMIRYGLVVVSFNYRLGVLGFLNTEDTQAPGNAGLKDAVMALKWVKNNIAAFGGDPEKITVVGEGAGGAIVHYLLLAPQMTDGLIHGAVSMSGSALAPWAFVERPREHAAALRSQLAALCPDTDADAIVPCLQSVDAAELVRSQETASPPELALRFWRGKFLPSVEVPAAGPHPFLRADPTQLMREGRFLKVPYVTGFTSAEGIMVLALAQLIANPAGWTDLDRRLEHVFRSEMPPGLRQELAVRQMRNFYLGDSDLRADDPEAVNGFVQMCTDVFVAVPTVSAARLMTQGGATVYVYEFSHEGPAAWLKTSLYNASHVPGVAHGDDLAYLFPHAKPGQPPASDPHDEAALRSKRVRHLANFAKTANPTPRQFGKPKWRVYTPSEESYLNMNTSFTAHDHVLGERINFWRQIAKCQTAETCELNPVVRVEQGLVKGRRQESVANCTYFSWQGVPYAKPPLGSLRFKDAVASEPWEGVRDALQDGNNCPQFSEDTAVGNEDCLFVNVHVPRRPSWLTDSFPVMLWVHGGGFVTGSGDASGVGPDYLICEDIIFVSLNYRLGVLGFLYLEAASPGNVGMKDQVFAERWVQANIAAFGGDPRRITIAGESAGSASVHLQMLSPMTHGLFQQAIAQSGAGLNPWAIQTTPVQTALNLAAALNCSADDDYAAVVECLRGVSADALVLAAENDAPTQVDRDRMVSFTFVPTPDYPVEGVETFLPAPVIELVTNNSHHAVPYLTGFNTRESILHLLYTNFRDPHIAELVDATWKQIILPDLRVPSNSSQVNEALQAMRQFFMNGEPLSNSTFFQFMDMITDIGFAEGIYKSVRHMAVAAKAPIHLYSFGIDDALNFLKIVLNVTDVPGAAHADDLGYLFRIAYLPDVPANSSAALARTRMVKMWTNYVKTGDPTPTYDPLIGARWRPYTNATRNYMDITSHLEAKTDLNEERVDFWEQFYRTYANETY